MTIEEIKAIKRLEFILEDKRQCIGSEQNFKAIEKVLKLVYRQQDEIEEQRLKENVISVVQINKKVLHPKMYYKKMEESTMKLKEEEIEALAVLDTNLELYGKGEPEFTYNQLDNLSKLIERLLDENEKLSKEV